MVLGSSLKCVGCRARMLKRDICFPLKTIRPLRKARSQFIGPIPSSSNGYFSLYLRLSFPCGPHKRLLIVGTKKICDVPRDKVKLIICVNSFD